MSESQIIFGAQYYRAPTPARSEWRSDLAHFKDHGFNTIKIWAQWRWNNPAEGVYDFSDMQELMDIAHENGLKVIINNIYDVAPAWFWKKYPEAVMIRNDGSKLHPEAYGCRQIGGAPGPSFQHLEGIAIRREFTTELAKQLGDHPALLVWDLWNEPELTTNVSRALTPGNLVDYSVWALAEFNQWLQRKYDSLEALNEVWGRNYQNWDEVEPPRNQSCIRDMIDWRMFFVDTLVEELRMRRDAIRESDATTPVMVHTVPMPYFNVVTCGSDEYQLAKLCDWFGNSVGSLPEAASLTVAAGAGRRMLNSEIHAIGGDTYNRPRIPTFDEMKRHIYVPLAKGVKGFLFWQYRPELLGLESPAWGLTDRAGEKTEWLDWCIQINNGMQAHAETLDRAMPVKADVAVVNGTKQQVFDWCCGHHTDRHVKSVNGAFLAMHHRQLNVDIVSTEFLLEQDLSQFKVIYFPFPYYMETAVAERLKQFVAEGGTLIGEVFFAGYEDETGRHAKAMPGLGFDEVFGVKEGTVRTSSSLIHAYGGGEDEAQVDKRNVPMTLTSAQGSLDAKTIINAFEFEQSLLPQSESVEVMAEFGNGHAAITRTTYGKGQAILIGSLLAFRYGHESTPEVADLISSLATQGGARASVSCDQAKVRVDLLIGEAESFMVVTNDADQPLEANLVFSDQAPPCKGVASTTEPNAEPIPVLDQHLTLSLTPLQCELYRLM